MRSSITRLPPPSHEHATCPWCTEHFGNIVDLIEHVEATHVSVAA